MEALKRLKYSIKNTLSNTYLRELLNKYRHLGLKNSDIFLVSYQNSGSTWLKNLIYETITSKKPASKRMEKEFPFVGSHKKTKPIVDGNRLIKSHSPYRKEYKGKKIIYMVRDPRDVAVSKYHKMIKEDHRVKSKDRHVKKFIRGEVMSEGRWDQHVRSWFKAREDNKVSLIFIRYEDLKENPVKELKRIGKFLKQGFSKERVKKTIRDNTIEKMKERERKKTGENKGVRKGKSGDWKKELSKKQVRAIEKSFKKEMEKLGYIK